MTETNTTVNTGETINFVFEGIDENIRKSVLEAIEFFSREKSENGNKIEDTVKVNKLRNAYNQLVSALINRLNKLNKHQRLFLSTGAIADIVNIDGKKVELLRPDIYAKLLETFEERDENNPFNKVIYTVVDKMKAIGEKKLELIDTSGKRKKKVEEKVDPKKLKAALEWKRKESSDAGANIIRTMGNDMDKIFQIDSAKLKNIRSYFEYIKKYFEILQKGKKLTPQEQKIKETLSTKVDALIKTLVNFTKLYADAFTRSNNGITKLKEKIDDIRQKDKELEKVANMVDEKEVAISSNEFGEEQIDLIKRDVTIINSFIVSASEKSPNKVPFSAARILLNAQIPDLDKANENYFCTPKNVMNSLQKILSIHINAFPKDEDGNYMIPPILIEPIRNYVDFLEDRFIMGFISGEPGKKGAKVSFTPVDFQVLRAIGFYLAKDPIYDYRGEINTGTFMGDYTGKLEKKAQVKWTGQEKKMTMALSSELVDAASREDAVEDYINFLFNIVNGLGPPPKMSKRKINVLLKYATIYNIENNVKILLQYVAQAEPLEVRETIVKYYDRNYDKAKNVVRQIVKEDQMVQRTLGNNPEYVVAKLFGA